MPRPVSRFGFLRGTLSGEESPVRPPWALAESAFRNTCDKCGDCVAACREGIITRGTDGLPRISFAKGECTFCADCVSACKPGALSLREPDAKTTRRPWAITADISNTCLSIRGTTCRVCGDVCDTRSISFKLAVGGIALPVVDGGTCTGCGACVAPCPVGGITVQ